MLRKESLHYRDRLHIFFFFLFCFCLTRKPLLPNPPDTICPNSYFIIVKHTSSKKKTKTKQNSPKPLWFLFLLFQRSASSIVKRNLKSSVKMSGDGREGGWRRERSSGGGTAYIGRKIIHIQSSELQIYSDQTRVVDSLFFYDSGKTNQELFGEFYFVFFFCQVLNEVCCTMI